MTFGSSPPEGSSELDTNPLYFLAAPMEVGTFARITKPFELLQSRRIKGLAFSSIVESYFRKKYKMHKNDFFKQNFRTKLKEPLL